MQEQFRHSIREISKPPFSLNQLARNQLRQSKLKGIMEQLARGSASKQIKSRYELYEGSLLIRKGKDGVQRIPLDFNSLLVLAAWVHLWSHAGETSTLKSMQTFYTSPYMHQVCRAVVGSCVKCLFGKPKLTKADVRRGISIRPRKIWDHLSIDHMHMGPAKSDLGNFRYLLIMIDPASRFLILRPTQTLGEVETARILNEVLSTFPSVTSMSSDNAKGLLGSQMVRKTLMKYDIMSILRLPRNPTSNSIVERGVQTLRSMFRIVQRAMRTNNWMEAYPQVSQLVNLSFRRYFFIQKGRVAQMWTSPATIAFGQDFRISFRQLLGDREGAIFTSSTETMEKANY